MFQPKYPIIRKSFLSHDKTKIGYQVMGKGKKTMVLCNGLGGFASAWSPLIDRMGDTYRFITWDYRGLASSDMPVDEARLSLVDHALDLAWLLQKEKIKRCVIGGWSMGVQVALEFYRQHPEKVSALFLLNGTSGYPFDTVLNCPLSRYILPYLNDLAKKIVPTIQPSLRPVAGRIIDWKGFSSLIIRLGLIHETVDAEIFKCVAKEMLATDLRAYHAIMSDLSRHDASDVLPLVRVPLLIVAGDQDVITPVRVAEKMTGLCGHAQLLVIPRGTHYSILEFPDLITLRLSEFLKECML